MNYSVHFLPADITIDVDRGTNLLAAAAAAGIYIQASCGGDGICRKCKVELVDGVLESRTAARLTPEEQGRNIRLACVSSIAGNLTVRIPAITGADGTPLATAPKQTRSLSAASLTQLTGTWQVDPPVRKCFVSLSPPTLLDNISDMQRLIREIKHRSDRTPEPDYDHPELLRELSATLREADWQVTVILLQAKDPAGPERIIAIEPGDTTAQLYGLALDIGTTTMNGLLVDLNSGQVAAQTMAYNSQVGCGEDIISRIIYAQRPNGLQILQQKAVGTINNIITDLCRQKCISPSDISFIMAAGNTVMAHLLLGISPRYIRESPYVPSISHFPMTKAAELGIMAHPSVRLFLYPCISSFVGGDIVAGVHACQLQHSDETTLFIDIGTNGEIVLGNREWMLCAACSAGPAFEGGGITFGMRADSGAIENIHLHPETLEPMIVTVGNTNPAGICGSGLIAIVAELLATKIIDRRGAFNHDRFHPRLREGADGWEYVLAWRHDSLIGQDITISEIDLDNLIRAKAALFAGYQTLLGSVGIGFDDLERVILAGNFGAHVDLERAIAIGLLPDIDRDRFFYSGNASLLGCRISLTDHRRFRERIHIRTLMTNVELADDHQFMHHYLAALFLPHTQSSLFPSCFET